MNNRTRVMRRPGRTWPLMPRTAAAIGWLGALVLLAAAFRPSH
jgi:hypothetical protein